MKFVTIKTFDSAIEAHILKAKLESEDIPSYIFDENIVTLNPLYNFAVGGIKLKVDRENVEKANAVLLELDHTPYMDKDEVPISCPNCHSTNIYSGFPSMKNVGGIIAAITSFFFFIFPFYYKSVYRCKECNTEFKADK